MWRKKRIPIDGGVGAVAHFCDCGVWREKNPTGEAGTFSLAYARISPSRFI